MADDDGQALVVPADVIRRAAALSADSQHLLLAWLVADWPSSALEHVIALERREDEREAELADAQRRETDSYRADRESWDLT